MELHYYDIDDIIAGEEIVTGSWSSDQPSLGFLAKKSDDETVWSWTVFHVLCMLVQLKSGTRVELPLWMAARFSTSELFTCYLPEKYNQDQRGHINADPTNVSLRASPYFYQVGRTISSLPTLAVYNLVPFLFSMWSARYQMILLYAHNFDPQADQPIIERMSLLEKEGIWIFLFLPLTCSFSFLVFFAARKQMELVDRWKSSGAGAIVPSILSFER